MVEVKRQMAEAQLKQAQEEARLKAQAEEQRKTQERTKSTDLVPPKPEGADDLRVPDSGRFWEKIKNLALLKGWMTDKEVQESEIHWSPIGPQGQNLGGDVLYAYNHNGEYLGKRLQGIQDDSGSALAIVQGGNILKGIGQAAARGLTGKIVTTEGKTVWNHIKPTQPVYEGTVLPKSFELSTVSGKVWVHGNATEHFSEYIIGLVKDGVSQDLIDINTQAQLTSLHSAVESVLEKGIKYGEVIKSGGWELKFEPPRILEGSPAMIHALYK
jgi:hypothetical protein